MKKIEKCGTWKVGCVVLLLLVLAVPMVGNAWPGGGGASSTQVTENTADITALEGDIDAFVGDITKSYVVVSGTDASDGTYQYGEMNESRPAYGGNGDPVFLSGVWTLYTDGCTNPATSYLPPYDGWMHNGTNVDVTVEWFSGQDAAETAARVAADALKVNITDGVATNLTVASTNTLIHGATGIPVAKFVTLTNGLELWVWKASTTVWVRQTEWTED